MYDYRPPHQNAKAKITVLLLLAAAVVAFGSSAFLTQLRAIPQCIGICLIVPVIQIAARYLILQYLYRLHTYEDGGVDFEIFTYRGGPRMQLVCRVGLEEITAIAPLTAQNKKPPVGIRRYNYCPDMAPAEALIVSIANEDGKCELLLSPDAHLSEIFRRAAESYKPPVQPEQI